MENPIDMGMFIADRTLAAFGIVPAKFRPESNPTPNYSPAVIAERAQLQSDIEKSEKALERFRTVDEPAKRKLVARKLVTLSFAASLAVEFGCPDDRLDVVLHQINLFAQAFDELRDIKGDIRLAGMEIEDAQRTLADAALWQDGGAA